MIARRVTTGVKRGSLFFLASFAAVSFPLLLGKWLWPGGLSAGAQFIFWPASGVNLALVLLWGPRYAPVILLDGVAAIWLLGEPVDRSLLGAAGNVLEVLAAWWTVTRLGRFAGSFDTTRGVAALALASLLATLCSTLSMPVWMVFNGSYPVVALGEAFLNYAFANGCGMMVLTPFLLALAGRGWTFPKHPLETAVWLLLAVLVGTFSFDAVFKAQINYAFLVFPLVIFAAVRFGPAECAASLMLVMVAVYASLVRYATALPLDRAPEVIWFVQAFVWVLAVTGLFVAALVAERRRAEREMLASVLREERTHLDALRYQINPHFLFNALNSIYAVLPSAAATPREMLAEVSDYLRGILQDPASDYLTLRDEFASVERYLAIEQKRFGDKLNIAVELGPGTEDAPVPIFLLQPLAENAVRHGMDQAMGTALSVELRTRREAAAVIVEVINSGHWVENPDRRGLGLENVRRRLKLLYEDRAILERESDGLRVILRVTLPAEPAPTPGAHDRERPAP